MRWRQLGNGRATALVAIEHQNLVRVSRLARGRRVVNKASNPPVAWRCAGLRAGVRQADCCGRTTQHVFVKRQTETDAGIWVAIDAVAAGPVPTETGLGRIDAGNRLGDIGAQVEEEAGRQGGPPVFAELWG